MSMCFHDFGPDATQTLSSCAAFMNHGAAAHSHGPSFGIGVAGVGPRLAPALLVVARVDACATTRLDRQAGDQRRRVAGFCDLVDLPTLRRLRRRGRERSRRASGRAGSAAIASDLRREHHQVADAEHLQVLHAEREVGGVVDVPYTSPRTGFDGCCASSLTVMKWNDVVADDSK